MVRRSGYGTSAQKEGRSAGQRKRRMARERKRRLREQNLYNVSVRSAVTAKARQDKENLAVYGIYNDGDKWVLTGMAVRRNREKLVSDRQGAVRSEVQERAVVVSRRGSLDPRDGFRISTFDTKKAAMSEVNADASTRLEAGMYVVRPSEWSRSHSTHKVDRDKYHEFLRSRNVSKVRD